MTRVAGKEVIIVHDNHGGGGAEYGAGTAAGWVSGHTATGWSTGGGGDSYSAGSHIGGGDNTYGGGGQDSYASGNKKKKKKSTTITTPREFSDRWRV